jgi:hypothetical protein
MLELIKKDDSIKSVENRRNIFINKLEFRGKDNKRGRQSCILKIADRAYGGELKSLPNQRAYMFLG